MTFWEDQTEDTLKPGLIYVIFVMTKHERSATPPKVRKSALENVTALLHIKDFRDFIEQNVEEYEKLVDDLEKATKECESLSS